MVTRDSLSLNRDWLFLGNKSLDIEFSFTFLESLYASTSVMNFFNLSPHVTADNFLAVLQSVLSLECQELLVYLCSKLQSVPRQSNLYDDVLSSIHLLICQLTRELISVSGHVHSRQQAAKPQLLRKEVGGAVGGAFGSDYSSIRSVEFDKSEQTLCKISQSLLTIFDNVPKIQLLALQLLAETGLDKVGIIEDFLPRISHSSVWSMPDVLDLYLELLERAWFQLSPSYTGSTEFWSKVSHYATPLTQGNRGTVMQVNYHLLFLLSHSSNHLKHSLTQHILLRCHRKLMDDFRNKVYTGDEDYENVCKVEFEIEEEKYYYQHLKLLQKMAAHPSSLVPFIQDPHLLFSLFLFLPIPRFRPDVLVVFRGVLVTLSTPWEASVPQAHKLTNNQIHYHLVNSLLRIAYEFNPGQVNKLCHQLSSSGMSTSCLDIRQVDKVHRTIQSFLDCSEIPFLLSSSVIHHLELVKDVWEGLAVTVETCSSLLHIMNDNQIWDIIQVLAPSLASLLERLQEWKSSDEKKESVEEAPLLMCLQETCVSLLCQLLACAMNMCRLKDNPLKVSDM